MFKKISETIANKKLQRTTDKINLEKRIWLQEKPLIEQENQINSEKQELKRRKRETKLPSWSKLLLIFLFINFTVLELFIGFITLYSFKLAAEVGIMPDLTPLITLITAVIGETISYWIYCAKSKAENVKDGIVYETTMFNLRNNAEDE